MITPFVRMVARTPGAIALFSFAITVSACAQATSQVTTQPAAATPAPATQKPAAPAAAAGAAAPAAAKAPTALMATSPDGTKIAYETAGTGPALILLHGGGQTRRSWNERGYVDRLSKRFTVITVDLRGSGESDKPDTPEAYALDAVLADVLAVADAAGAKRFHLWGFGHGASIGRYLAARSDRVISAVLVGADMGPTISGPVKDAINGMRAKWQPLLEAQKAGKLDLKGMSPGDRDAWNSGVARQAIALGALVDYPALEPAEIKAPTLWLIGAADESGLVNAKAYEGKLAGTKVTLKQVSGLSYSDTFARIDPILAEAEPFLAANPGTN
ncbi:MAG: alpha/beta fold hydrolase [Acidobacteria bacterium]|nr:alpha/beta fold hydrolase [Acidobacteriota bacterium]